MDWWILWVRDWWSGRFGGFCGLEIGGVVDLVDFVG